MKLNAVSGKSSLTFGKTVRFFALAVLVLTQLYPLLYAVFSSFKSLEEFQANPPYALPQNLYLENYRFVLTQSPLGTYFFNSILIMVIVVIAVLILSSTAAFAIEKMRFRGKSKLLTYFLLGLMIPMQVCLVPLYLTFTKLHWTDSYISVILPQIAFGLPFSIYLFANFFRHLSNDVLEASIIDGCSAFQMFTRIVLPMSRNTVLTLAMMRGVFCWNEFMFAYTFTKSKSMQTVTLGLQDFVGMYGYTDWGRTFTTIVLTVFPTLVLYFFLGKYMISGLSSGSVKE